jgi:diaminopropionate ammonia-lyase
MALLFTNPARRDGPSSTLTAAGFADAYREIAQWPGYARTPLHSLVDIARESGVGTVFYKDESERFGLGSFKALGGAYAVLRILQSEVERATGKVPAATQLADGEHRHLTQDIAVSCATDGNHGRSVAWGSQLFGCRSAIYIHETVSDARAAAIAAYGAEVCRVPGNYDDAVRAADLDAKTYGRFVVSDTSYPGYTDIPRAVMYGYGVMAAEALDQMVVPPTHIFVQAGVGALAGAVAAYADTSLRTRPIFVTAEPVQAACVYESLLAGAPRVVHGRLDTIMAGLACGEVSLLAWDILKTRVDAAMVVNDADARDMMRRLARDIANPIVAGESAVAGLAALLAAACDPEQAARLKLDRNSRILIFGTEGATDPALYAKIVGHSAEKVLQGRAA